MNNGNTLNNLLIVNKKVKSVKNDNYNHNMKIKKRMEIQNYLPYKKVDLQYYLREKKKKK